MKINITQIVRDVCFAATVVVGAWVGGCAACAYNEKNAPSYAKGYARGRRDEFNELYKIAHEGTAEEEKENETEEEEEDRP